MRRYLKAISNKSLTTAGATASVRDFKQNDFNRQQPL
jgi:hypothetical protein